MIVGFIIGLIVMLTLGGLTGLKLFKAPNTFAQIGYSPEKAAYDEQFRPQLNESISESLEILTTRIEDAAGNSGTEGAITVDQTGATVESSDGRVFNILQGFEWIGINGEKVTFTTDSEIILRLGYLVPILEVGKQFPTRDEYEKNKNKIVRVRIVTSKTNAFALWQSASLGADNIVYFGWKGFAGPNTRPNVWDTESVGSDFLQIMRNVEGISGNWRDPIQQITNRANSFVKTKMWIPITMAKPFGIKQEDGSRGYKIDRDLSDTVRVPEDDGDVTKFFECKDDKGTEHPTGTKVRGKQFDYVCVPAVTSCQNIACTSDIHQSICASDHVSKFVPGFDVRDGLAYRKVGPAYESGTYDPSEGEDSWKNIAWRNTPDEFRDMELFLEWKQPLCDDKGNWLDSSNPDFQDRMNRGLSCNYDQKFRTELRLLAQGYEGISYVDRYSEADDNFAGVFVDVAKICHCPPYKNEDGTIDTGRVRMCGFGKNNDLDFVHNPVTTSLMKTTPNKGGLEGWLVHGCKSFENPKTDDEKWVAAFGDDGNGVCIPDAFSKKLQRSGINEWANEEIYWEDCINSDGVIKENADEDCWFEGIGAASEDVSGSNYGFRGVGLDMGVMGLNQYGGAFDGKSIADYIQDSVSEAFIKMAKELDK